MNRILVVAALLLAVTAFVPSVDAQIMRHSGGEGGDLVILTELGVVAGPQRGSDDLQVLTLLPDGAGKSDVKLEEGDLLLMINGRRVRDVASLREAYEGAEVGETVKVGFRRGDERFLASFEKQPPAPGERRVMMIGGPGHDMGDMHPLPEFGVILTETDGKVVVGMEMPTDRLALENEDVVTRLNGSLVETLAEFRETYEQLSVGDDLLLVVVRGDEEINVTRAKMDPGMMRMKVAR